ncbi:MAG: hypothetical protein Q7P63_08325 [Verrucomicrobiota bacterium JB022]|nr:hypothetical protein [Verrucomicrobiota bacterium JB022]
MKQHTLLALSLIMGSLVTTGLQASVLASYDFTGIGTAQLTSSYATTVPGTAAATTGANISASPLIAGLYDTSIPSYGLTASGSNIAAIGTTTGPVITDNLAVNGIGSTEIDTGGEYDAKVTNDFLQFTLTPAAGMSLDFGAGDVLSFDAQIRYGGSGSLDISTTLTAALYTDADGYASQVDNTTLTHTGAGGTKTGFSSLSIDLASLGMMAADTPLSFRLYLYTDAQTLAGSTTLSNRNIDLDNFVVNGGVTAVPEPSIISLAMAVATFAFVWQRRKRA